MMKLTMRSALLALSLCCAAALSHAQSFNTVLVASGLSQPLYATSPVAGGPVYVVQKGGLIRAVQGGTVNNFLQISVGTAGERGLLGMAFDPNYTVAGSPGQWRFFVDYIDPVTNQTVIASYRTNGNPLAADPASRVEIMRIDQPAGLSNHKGGWIGFKPGDSNNLYIATGDGGSSNDPGNNAQNRNSLLGKMLRININGDDFPDPNINYAIPANNPFVGQAGTRPEIFALGLRNPFRNSFDRLTADMLIADVGQNAREEVDFIAAASAGGQNFGWRIREGEIATPGISDPPVAGLINPALVYTHALGVSITGGYVVRQVGSPLYGMYVFGDFGSARVWGISAALLADGQLHQITEATDLTATVNAGGGGSIGSISSFGEGPNGELYIVGYGNGKVVMVVHDVPLSSLTVASPTLNAGATTIATVSLASPAAVDTVVSLSSSHPTAAVPSSVVVPQGATSATFLVTGGAVVRDRRSVTAVITATLGKASSSVAVQVLQRP
jgi:glucose/arabinose dehydrogenase